MCLGDGLELPETVERAGKRRLVLALSASQSISRPSASHSASSSEAIVRALAHPSPRRCERAARNDHAGRVRRGLPQGFCDLLVREPELQSQDYRLALFLVQIGERRFVLLKASRPIVSSTTDWPRSSISLDPWLRGRAYGGNARSSLSNRVDKRATQVRVGRRPRGAPRNRSSGSSRG